MWANAGRQARVTPARRDAGRVPDGAAGWNDLRLGRRPGCRCGIKGMVVQALVRENEGSQGPPDIVATGQVGSVLRGVARPGAARSAAAVVRPGAVAIWQRYSGKVPQGPEEAEFMATG